MSWQGRTISESVRDTGTNGSDPKSSVWIVDRPTQLICIWIFICICQQTNVKDIAGQSARVWIFETFDNTHFVKLRVLENAQWWWNPRRKSECEKSGRNWKQILICRRKDPAWCSFACFQYSDICRKSLPDISQNKFYPICVKKVYLIFVKTSFQLCASFMAHWLRKLSRTEWHHVLFQI